MFLYRDLIIMYILQLFTLQFVEIHSFCYSCNLLISTVTWCSTVWPHCDLFIRSRVDGYWDFFLGWIFCLFLLMPTVLLWTFLYLSPTAHVQEFFRVDIWEWNCWVRGYARLQSWDNNTKSFCKTVVPIYTTVCWVPVASYPSWHFLSHFNFCPPDRHKTVHHCSFNVHFPANEAEHPQCFL